MEQQKGGEEMHRRETIEKYIHYTPHRPPQRLELGNKAGRLRPAKPQHEDLGFPLKGKEAGVLSEAHAWGHHRASPSGFSVTTVLSELLSLCPGLQSPSPPCHMPRDGDFTKLP